MARQDLAYSITVNDAQLRLATQHVGAFNAELARSTVTGRGVDQAMRSVGRRAAQTGAFFTRNLTLPFLLAGVAAGKYANDFQKASAKVQGLAGTTVAEINQINAAINKISSHEASLGPKELETAAFHLRSAGLSVAATIKTLPTISRAAVSGLGNIAAVTTAVTSAMDSYGFANLNAAQTARQAAHFTDVLVKTVAKGNIPVEQLSSSIGRVTSLANAMGISFDQVGAAVASITRQMPNANLAVTGFRAILATVARDQPQVEKALNRIGASGAGVQESFRKVGLFPTLLALRQQFKHVTVDEKVLEEAFKGGGQAQAKLVAGIGGHNTALAHLFPNVRALAAFLILTGNNAKFNANIFAELSDTTKHVGQALNQTFGAFAKTDAGKLRLAIGQLQVEAEKLGPSFIRAGASALQMAHGVLEFFQHLGPFKGLAKDIGFGLLIFGPLVSLFGRLTQAASFGVTMWGRWQVAATEAAYAAHGVDIAADKNTIATRKATVQIQGAWNGVTAAVERTTAAIERQAVALQSTSVRGGVLAASGQNAFLSKTSKGRALSRNEPAPILPISMPGAVAVPGIPGLTPTASTVDSVLMEKQVAAQAQLAAAQSAVAASARNAAAANALALPSAVKLASTKHQEALSALSQAETNARLLIPGDARLLALDRERVAALEQITIAQRTGSGASIAQQRYDTAETAILERQRELLSLEVKLRQAAVDITGIQTAAQAKLLALQANTALPIKERNIAAANAGLLGAQSLLTKTRESARMAGGEVALAAQITATKWGTAIEGMKSGARVAFPLIALIFGTEVASKIIFDSHRTKEAVTHDMLDINKGLITTIGALAVGGAALSKSIRGANGPKTLGADNKVIAEGFTALALNMRRAGAEGLSLKAKLALLAAGLIGGQAAGIGFSHTLNAVFAGILAKQVTGFALSKIFTSWGAKAVAARAGIIGLSVAITDLLANDLGPTKHFFGVLDKFASQHIDKHIPFFGQWLSKRDAKDAAVRLGEVGKAAKKALGPLSGLDEFQKQQLQPIPVGFKLKDGTNARAAIVDLFKKGNAQGATNLIYQIEMQVETQKAKQAIKLLDSEGKHSAANLLKNFLGAAKEAKKSMDTLFGNIADSIDNAFQARTDRMLDTFDRQTQNILKGFDRKTSALDDAFDAQTEKLRTKLTTSVKLKDGTIFKIRVDGKTPAERELEALDKIQERRNFRRDMFDARQHLGTALQIGDPNAIRDAQRKLEDAQTEKKKSQLDDRAKIERPAADKALKATDDAFSAQRKKEKQALDDRRDAIRQSISDNRDIIRRNVEATRKVLEDNLKAALSHEKDLFDNNKIGLTKYKNAVQGIMKKFGVSLSQDARDGGGAYAEQMKGYFKTLTADIKKENDKVKADIKATADAMDAAAGRLKKAGGFLAAAAPLLFGPKGAFTVQAMLEGAGAQAAAAQHQATVTKNQASKSGLPTRPAIVSELKAINGGIEYARYGKFLAHMHGLPSEKEYKGFLQKITDTSVRAELQARLKKDGFMRAATGAVVPGQGSTDSVPALLTPGEIILNRPQQRGLASQLGIPGASPSVLFSLIASRFAKGGVSGGSVGTIPPITIPGLEGLVGPLKKLVDLMSKAAIRSDQQAPGNDALMTELALGGHLDKSGKLVRDSAAKIKKLRKQLDPQSANSLLTATIPHFGSMSGDQKRAAQALVAQSIAHPVSTGLFSPHADAPDTSGGTRTARGPTAINPAAFTTGTSVGSVTIIVQGADKDPRQIASEVKREFERVGTHHVHRRRGPYAGPH